MSITQLQGRPCKVLGLASVLPLLVALWQSLVPVNCPRAETHPFWSSESRRMRWLPYVLRRPRGQFHCQTLRVFGAISPAFLSCTSCSKSFEAHRPVWKIDRDLSRYGLNSWMANKTASHSLCVVSYDCSAIFSDRVQYLMGFAGLLWCSCNRALPMCLLLASGSSIYRTLDIGRGSIDGDSS